MDKPVCTALQRTLCLHKHSLAKSKLEASSVKICTSLTTNCTEELGFFLIDISMDSLTPTLIGLVSTNKPTTFVGKQALALPKSCACTEFIENYAADCISYSAKIRWEGRKGLVLMWTVYKMPLIPHGGFSGDINWGNVGDRFTT